MSVVAFPLGAQESPLRPLSEQLAEAPEGSAETMRYVARRCSALFSLVSDQYERRRDAGTAEMYMSWSLNFELAAARVDIELGASPEDAVRNNKAEIAQMADGLRERVNRARSLGDDPLLASDVRTCRVLVDDLGLEMPPMENAPEGSAETMRSVARRCSALFSLVSDQYERRRDAGTAEMYMSWSLGFELAAARVDIELGASPEDAVRNNKAEIAQIADGLRERVNRTRSLGDDPLLASDVRACRVLVDDLGLEGTPGFPPAHKYPGA
jgi:hypothetical protein